MTTPQTTMNGTTSRVPAHGFDNRAYVFWRPGQGEGLLAAVERHRRQTGWQGYILVRSA